MSALERRAIRDQLIHIRCELESAMVNVTTIAGVNGVALTVHLQTSIMVTYSCFTFLFALKSLLIIHSQELLQYFIGIGGKVLGAPLYYTDHSE